MSDTLENILARCRAGQPEAVAVLVHRFRPWALDLARALLNNDAGLAEDAVQEAFIAALQRLDDLRNPAAFPGWFRQIIRTHAGRIARAQRATRPRSGPDRVQEGPSSPSAIFEREELHRLVRAAIDNLPASSRETTKLFYLDDRSCAEVSSLLRVPTGTVKRRLHDARKRLRDMLLGSLGEIPPERHDSEGQNGRLPL